MKTTTKAHLAVLFTNLFFAANYSFVKLISPAYILPFALNEVRVGICSVLLWCIWLLGDTKAGIARTDIGRFFLCGLTGIAINQMLFIKGLTMTSTTHASLLMLTTPLLITVFAFWVLKEAVTGGKIAGLVLGIAGALMLILSKGSSSGQESLVGDVLIVTNAICYSVYFILVQPLMQRYSPLHVIRWVFTIGFFMIFPFAFSELKQFDPAPWGAEQWMYLSAVVFTGTFLAYYFNAYGLQHLGAGVTGAYIYTQPVFAFILAAIVLGERLSPVKLVAAVLIFSGVYLVSFRKQKE